MLDRSFFYGFSRLLKNILRSFNLILTTLNAVSKRRNPLLVTLNHLSRWHPKCLTAVSKDAKSVSHYHMSPNLQHLLMAALTHSDTQNSNLNIFVSSVSFNVKECKRCTGDKFKGKCGYLECTVVLQFTICNAVVFFMLVSSFERTCGWLCRVFCMQWFTWWITALMQMRWQGKGSFVLTGTS